MSSSETEPSRSPNDDIRQERKWEILRVIREAKDDGDTALGKDDPVTVRTIADRMGVTLDTVHHHCNWMDDDGILESRICLVGGRGPSQKGFVVAEDLDAEEPQYGYIPPGASAD